MQSALLKKQRLNSSLPCDLKKQYTKKQIKNQLMKKRIDALRLWDGSPIPSGLRRRLLRVYAHHQFLSEQISALEAERCALLHTSPEASIEKVRQLMQLKGIKCGQEPDCELEGLLIGDQCELKSVRFASRAG